MQRRNSLERTFFLPAHKVLPGLHFHQSRVSGAEIRAARRADIRASRALSMNKMAPRRRLSGSEEPEEVFEKDSDLISLRKHITEEFSQNFAKGVTAYLIGDWEISRTFLTESDRIMRNSLPEGDGDGPSQTLLAFMGSYQFIRPSSWTGCRNLESK